MKKFTVKTVLVMLFSTALIISCKDNDEAPINCYVTTFTDGEVVTFTYTSDNKLKTVSFPDDFGGSETSTISYDAQGNISKIQGLESSTVYTYNANNQVTKEERFEGTVLNYKTDYEYNSSNQLVSVQEYEVAQDGTASKAQLDTYEYSSTTSKNPTKKKSYYSNGTLYKTTEYTYDDKKLFYSGISTSTIFGGLAEQENNETKSVEKNDVGEVQSTTTYVYEYNENGYPTKVTETEVSQWGNYEQTTLYTYDCK